MMFFCCQRLENTKAVFTINNNNSRVLIAFSNQQQAKTFRRLYSEIHFKGCQKRDKTIIVDSCPLQYLMVNCQTSSLDIMFYNSDNQRELIESEKEVSDEFRCILEMNYLIILHTNSVPIQYLVPSITWHPECQRSISNIFYFFSVSSDKFLCH